MKTRTSLLLGIAISLSSVLLTQCAAPRTTVASAITPANTPRMATPTPRGEVTLKALGNSTVATRRLIHHPLTNKDIGKVYEEITIVSPTGTSMEERVIVRAEPKLETKLVTR